MTEKRMLSVGALGDERQDSQCLIPGGRGERRPWRLKRVHDNATYASGERERSAGASKTRMALTRRASEPLNVRVSGQLALSLRGGGCLVSALFSGERLAALTAPILLCRG